MRKAFALALLIVLSLPFTSNRAEAQLVLVPYAGYNVEDIVGGLLVGIGAEFVAPFEISNLDLSIMPSAEYVFSEDYGGGFGTGSVSTSVFQINGDVIAKFAPSGSIAPFAGAGLAVVVFNVDSDVDSIFGDSFDASSTDIGLNLLGGVSFPGAFGTMEPYAMGRLTLAGGNALSLIGGLRIPLGAN